ncbi:HlyD family efflux transporter periplasmic adaptor subunit [Pseudanabaena sp. PCC 6802]|uniref:HlyD family efflux transporter periplasmic adaptor subunit n=1 Tax=Pseudanabaena sp. PCC 6802 TaxID=118173 RepID=UPI0003817C72|nr:HlyD family efflux transporter periplasmic adaptor subunit [Pseudanabaena sp. PCC 6802]
MTTVKKIQSRNRWIVAAAVGAIALGSIGFGIAKLTLLNKAQSDRVIADIATSQPRRIEVVALGRLEPQGEVIRVGGPNGERIRQLTVKEGNFVEKGTILAYLESYIERLAERDLAASQVAEAEQRLKASTDYSQSQIQEASTRIQQIERPRAFEIDAQKAAIRKLEAELALANIDLQRNQSLLNDGAIAKQALDRQVSQVEQLQAQVTSAKATLIKLETGWQTDMQNAKAQMRSQEANLPLTQIQVALRSARQNLKLAEARLERTLIRATKSGRVLRIITHEGEAIGSNGILDLGNTRQMYVVAEVYETDVGLVAVGQPVTIASRNGAFETPLKGKVAEIGWQVFKNNVLDDDPAANADARVVEVKIRLDDSKPVEGLTNLQVDVRIAAK